MESRFGLEFGHVRLHTGSEAAQSAKSLNAAAYTVGPNIVVGDHFDPHSLQGKRLLAHELTHVVQQAAGPVAGNPIGDGLAVSDPSDRFEREAERTAESVMAAHGPGLTAGGDTAIQRLVVQRADAGDSGGQQAVDAFEAAFKPDEILSAMAGMGGSAAPAGGKVTAQTLTIQREGPTAAPGPGTAGAPTQPLPPPEPARPAEVGDLAKAVAKSKEGKAALDMIEKEGKARARQLLKESTPATLVAVGTVAASIVFGTGAALLSNADTRAAVATMAGAVRVPVPGTNGSLTVGPLAGKGTVNGAILVLDVMKLVAPRPAKDAAKK
jgi:hypothetical protein